MPGLYVKVGYIGYRSKVFIDTEEYTFASDCGDVMLTTNLTFGKRGPAEYKKGAPECLVKW